jgi:hypothetical protein
MQEGSMDAVSLLVGLSIGVVIGFIAAGLRRTPTLGGTPWTATPTTEASTGDSPAGSGPLHLTRTFVGHRARTVVTTEGIKVEVDGKSYASLDEVPDQALRENLRKVLAESPAAVPDPAMKERLIRELHAVGIEPVDPGDNEAALTEHPPAHGNGS